MNDSEITRLIELAGRATKGDWGWVMSITQRGAAVHLNGADAEYIVAANPETIRSLAEEVLRLRQWQGEARELLQRARSRAGAEILHTHWVDPEMSTKPWASDLVLRIDAALASPSPEPAL